jgi:peptidoglycan LD-endopeptidase LytH
MGRFINRLGWVIVTAVLVSAFWIFYFGILGTPAGKREVAASGEKITVDPKAQPPVTLAEGIWVGPAGLAVPVQGIKPAELSDTFTQARAGGARSHDAIDIMAAEGTPVLSASDGTVEKLFFSDGGGGITVYVRSPDQRWTFYYAHLQGYAPGLAEGQKVKRGQLLGRVGHSGNANPAGPHLHFAINRMEPGQRWWQGNPINPYPLLAGRPVNR